ncbi:centrosomal protein 43 isoform X5 [Amia ocellicauda]|uniref:centrosomal protein 43 isoform X5 n=1 Tax=Amia ocellicauda TaxID=2972642 RepID=UPI003463F5A0
MSAAEEDTELRDLLVQNLENSGVLNKIKAELRAAVFLALEEQEKIESKTPLVNESLKRCLNTKDGRLVASLITDYLQVFNLDFTLAVFHPEINTLNGLESREAVARELGITEPEGNKNTPLLLEIVKRGRHKEKGSSSSAEGDQTVHIPKELSPKQIAEARKKFEHYDKDKSGEISKDELRTLFIDLFPHFHKNMLERYVTDEFRAVDKNFSNSIDFNEFLGMYKRLFIQCRSVVTCDVSDIVQTPSTFIEEKISTTSASKIPRYKGLDKQREEKAGEKGIEESYCDTSMKNKSNIQLSSRGSKLSENSKEAPLVKSVRDLDVDVDVDEEEEEEGDSFFDDPLPKPQKTYGWRTNPGKPVTSLTSLSDAPPLKSGLGSLSGVPPLTDVFESTNGNCTDGGLKDLKTMNDKIGSLGLGDEDEEYDDDFNSTSHRSDKTKSEVSIGEEIEEVSIEGVDFNASDKLEDLTQDHSISQFSEAADYMEEVASVSQK